MKFKLPIESKSFCNDHESSSELNFQMMEFYVEIGMPSFEDFFKRIEADCNFDTANELYSLIECIVKAGEETKKHIKKIEEFVHEIRNFPSRKEIADAIKKNHKGDSTLAFSILNGKLISNKQYLDLIKKYFSLTDF